MVRDVIPCGKPRLVLARWVVAWLVWCVHVPAWAKPPDGCGERDERAFLSNFTWENDGTFWMLRSNSDDRYTNGLRLAKMWREAEAPCWSAFLHAPFAPLTKLLYNKGFVIERGWAVGQNLYTPKDLRATEINPRDRPYAAWLYLGATARAFPREKSDRLHTMEVDVGVVGPGAGGRLAQTAAHILLRGITARDEDTPPDPLGWHHQVKNEPGVLVRYLYQHRFGARPVGTTEKPVRIFDVIPGGGVVLGNVLTYANLGGVARLGYNLGNEFGTSNIISIGGQESALDENAVRRGFEMWAFGGWESRFVARNIFLQGNAFDPGRSPHTVPKKSYVDDYEYGAAMRIRGFRVTWRRVSRRSEFPFRSERQWFGSWNFTVVRNWKEQ